MFNDENGFLNKTPSRPLLVFLSIWLVLYFYFSQIISIVPSASNNWQMSDFVYYTMLVRAFWFDSLEHIYSLSANLKAISLLINDAATPLPMPVGLTPLLVVTYGPLALLTYISFELSQAFWISLSITFFLNQISKLAPSNKHYFYGACALCFLSACSISTIILGQTSILAVALLLLSWRIFSGNSEEPKKELICVSIATIILGIKLHYFAFFIALLGVFGRWKLLGYSLLLFSFANLLAAFSFEPGWFSNFILNLQVFTSGDIPEHYLHAFGLSRVNSFYSAFGSFLSIRTSAQMPSLILVATYATVVVKRLFEDIKEKKTSTNKETARFLMLLSFYLVLAPYVAAYEELMLLLVGCIFWANINLKLSKVTAYLLFTTLLILLNFTAFPANKPIWFFWSLKLLFLGTVCLLSYKSTLRDE